MCDYKKCAIMEIIALWVIVTVLLLSKYVITDIIDNDLQQTFDSHQQ